MASYLVYVLNRHRQAAIAGAANRLAKIRTADDLPLLYAATDALLDCGQTPARRPICGRRSEIPGREGITHPNFEEPRTGHGFDWVFAEISGVTQLALDATGHRIRFSGQQPESCELLRQVVGGLRAGAAYTLHWEARTQGIASPTGLEWRIAGRAGEVAASEDWSAGKMAFTPDSDHAVLVLTYRRPEGEVRTEGQWT